jgi:hypothetical protein
LCTTLFGCLGGDEETSSGEYSYGVASTSSGGGAATTSSCGAATSGAREAASGSGEVASGSGEEAASSGGEEAATSSSVGGGDEVEGSFGNQFFVVFFLGFRFVHTRKEVSSVFKIVLQNGIMNLIIAFSWFH